jgi:hypothetical protein
VKRWLAASLIAAVAGPARAAAPRAAVLPSFEVRALSLPAALPSLASPLALLQESAGLSLHLAPLPGLTAAANDTAVPWRSPAISALDLPGAVSGQASSFAPAATTAHAGATVLSGLQVSALDGAGATGRGVSAAGARALSARAFDGSGTANDNGGVEGGEDRPILPPYLASPEPEHAAWIASVVQEARRSKTGRAVLGRVARLAQTQDHPIMITVSRIGNSGEYAFDHEIVTMDAAHMDRPPEEAAPVFLHELQHVLQLAQGLPADAFEMELEAYLTQFQVTEELGLKAPKGSFHASAWRRFKNDPDRFIVWLKKEYEGNLAIVGSSVEDYAAELEGRLHEAQVKVERLEKRAGTKRRVVERMLKTGQPQPRIEQYRLDELAPLEDKIRVARRELGWFERDLLLLRTPETRERYQRYAARVLKKARAYHSRLNS